MAVKSVVVANNLTPNTNRGPSSAIWDWQAQPNGGPIEFMQDPSLGMQFFEEFDQTPPTPATGAAAAWGRWAAYADTNGVITDAAIVGGGIKLAAATTAGQGVALSSLSGGYQFITPGGVYQGKMCFEARVLASTILTSQQDTFVGLMDNGGGTTLIPITGTPGLLSTTPNLIGFHKRGGTTNPADWSFVYQLAAGTAVYALNLQNLVNTITGSAYALNTWVKLGFVFDPGAPPLIVSSASDLQTVNVLGVPALKVFVNGQAATAFLTKTNLGGVTFPTGVMSPCVAFKQQSTTSGIFSQIDWLRVAQTASS